MTIRNRVNSSNRDTQEHVVERRSRRLVVSVLTVGVMLGILIAPFLLVENGLAAGAVADEPCLMCPVEASVAADAAWYSGMPSLAAYYATKTEANLAADNDSVAADAAWYSGMPSLAAYYAAKTEANLAADKDSVAADAAWYSGMPSLAAYYAAKT
jgi:hypothetical protein